MSFQSREEKDTYLRELRDRAAVAVLPSIVEDCQKHMGQLDETWRTGAGIEAKRIGEALVAALYPEEVGDE